MEHGVTRVIHRFVFPFVCSSLSINAIASMLFVMVWCIVICQQWNEQQRQQQQQHPHFDISHTLTFKHFLCPKQSDTCFVWINFVFFLFLGCEKSRELNSSFADSDNTLFACEIGLTHVNQIESGRSTRFIHFCPKKRPFKRRRTRIICQILCGLLPLVYSLTPSHTYTRTHCCTHTQACRRIDLASLRVFDVSRYVNWFVVHADIWIDRFINFVLFFISTSSLFRRLNISIVRRTVCVRVQ